MAQQPALPQHEHDVTRLRKLLGRPLSEHDLIMYRLVLLLFENDTEDYVSPAGYRFKKITKRQAKEEAA